MSIPVKPSSKVGWWAFWLGVTTPLTGVGLIASMRVLAPIVAATGLRIPLGFGSVALTIPIAIAAIVTGIIALVRKDRAWLVIAGLVPAVLVGGFWMLFAAGEVLYPH